MLLSDERKLVLRVRLATLAVCCLRLSLLVYTQVISLTIDFVTAYIIIIIGVPKV